MIYKIILDSNDTLSYEGNQYNANYFINMNEVVLSAEDLDKSYIMDIKITSRSSFSSESGFNPSIIYGYNIDLGKKINAYKFNNKRFNCCGHLRFENNSFLYTSITAGGNTTYNTQLNIKVDDGNFFISSLRNISNISFRVSSSFDNTIFVSADDTKSVYQIVLTFKECNMVMD